MADVSYTVTFVNASVDLDSRIKTALQQQSRYQPTEEAPDDTRTTQDLVNGFCLQYLRQIVTSIETDAARAALSAVE
jgi:hypothetical protein